MPLPRMAHDGFNVAVLGLPVEGVLGFGATAHEGGGITGAAFLFDHLELAAGDGFHRLDDLAHGEAAAVAKVKDIGFAAVEEVFEAEDVGGGEVGDVDVVADASAVTGGVIGAEDGDGVTVTEGGIEGEGDQVGFGVVVFTKAAIGVGSGGVEVAEPHGAEVVGAIVVIEDGFDHQFSLAVGVNRVLGVGFGDGEDFGHAVGGAGGGEDEGFDPGGPHRVEEGEGSEDVVLIVFGGVGDGFADVGIGGEVDDGGDRMILE